MLRVLISCLFVALSSFLTSMTLASQPQTNQDLAKMDLWTPPTYGVQKALGYDAYSFSVPKTLEGEVQFWIQIYSRVTSHQGIFHYVGKTDKILGEIDMTAIYANPKWGPIRKEKEADKFIARERRKLAQKLKLKDEKKIRFQRGLADTMRQAIITSGQYLPMMEKVFQDHNLPIELTRLVFVESSFNVDAKSRVGASGLWQIMPNIGKKFKYIQKSYDKRDHPYYATKLAAKILKENYQILKNWPLAVTSYNYGVGSMLKAKRKLGTRDVEIIFGGKGKNPYLGFASRNFYATFLAALHVESHANIYFGEPFLQKKPLDLTNEYLGEPVPLKKMLSENKLSRKQFLALNPHIKNKYVKTGATLPKGTLVTLPRKPEPEKMATQNELATPSTDD